VGVASLGRHPSRRSLQRDPGLVDVQNLLGTALADHETTVVAFDQSVVLQF
jgi:hypothetical protein